MALTNDELESALNALDKRLAQLEKLIKNSVAHVQFNSATLLIEKDINDLKADMLSTKNRVTTLEGTVADIV